MKIFETCYLLSTDQTAMPKNSSAKSVKVGAPATP